MVTANIYTATEMKLINERLDAVEDRARKGWTTHNDTDSTFRAIESAIRDLKLFINKGDTTTNFATKAEVSSATHYH